VKVAALPTPADLAPWSRLVGKVADWKGTALSNTTVRAELNGVELASTLSEGDGTYALTLWGQRKQWT
jgi:hypothetical protein